MDESRQAVDHAPPGFRTRVDRAARTVLALVVLYWGLTLLGDQQPAGPPPQPGAAQAFGTEQAGAAARNHAQAPLPAADPVRVVIPQIKVDAPLMGLNLDDDGRLAAPPDSERNLAGWYQEGTSPGASGTAILGGHVDTAIGPAVFYALGSLNKGDTVQVPRTDGITAVFTVDAVEVYAADDFPDTKVYGPSTTPQLRLITCGGGYDKKAGRYLGNVVVYAHLTGRA
ncbi:class F sortase [Streptomyces sp. NPDC004111]|uniref:class F sortase n=1 Tax=Streptomyces sp. NPDC004111 TaxID=3364690 RepID=UPI0036BB94D9